MALFLLYCLPVQVFSLTKSVVGMLADMAVANGKLDIDAPIGQYSPDEPCWEMLRIAPLPSDKL